MYVEVRWRAGRPVGAPFRRVLDREEVEIAPLDNTVGVYVGTQGEASALYGPRRVVAPGSAPQRISVANLGEIFVLAQVSGEGISITVREAD